MLVCHPDFTSETKDKNKVIDRYTVAVRFYPGIQDKIYNRRILLCFAQDVHLKLIVEHLKKMDYVTDTLSQGELKFMVSIHAVWTIMLKNFVIFILIYLGGVQTNK